jgi:hypothetical protein
MNIGQVIQLVDVIGKNLVNLFQLLLTGYVIRLVASGVFAYLMHRLDVLGKDGYVLYPRDRYESVGDGRVMPKLETETRRETEEPNAPRKGSVVFV